MVFSNMIFLCAFLPVTFLIYSISPKRLRNLWLLGISLFFYAWGEPRYIWIMVFSTIFDYVNGRMIDTFQDKKPTIAKAVLILSIVGNLSILGFFKYTDFFIQSINTIGGFHFDLLELALPIGISFYTFQTMSYTIDVYLRNVNAQKNFIDFAMYVCLFPQLIAGPIVRYQDVADQIKHRTFSFQQISEGLFRFLIGLGKKVIIANQMGAIWQEISNYSGNDRSMTIAWLGAVAYTLQIYFDFSGYSDMAIGLGKIFGFIFPENFLHPYESKSITEFWRKWHVTLSSWFRQYVYIPLGGNRTGKLRLIFNLFLVWFLTGFWHGAGWNFIFWGIYYFCFLLLEKMLLQKWMKKWNTVFLHIYTMLVVLWGWVLFASEDIFTFWQYGREMLGIGVSIGNALSVYQWLHNIPLLLIGCIGATTLPQKIAKKLIPEKWLQPGSYLYAMVLLFISTAFLVSGSYNPFLYFRF